jgi:large repetitive protein
LDYKKQTILILILGALFSITWINVRLVGTYAQIVPSIQSPPTSEQTSTNNSAAITPFSLPSFKLDKNNSVAIAKSGPIAVAGPDQIVNEGSTVTLNGTESRDPNGIILSYSWKQIPTTHFITLSGADTPVWSFTAPRVSADTMLRFELAVTDNNGSTDSSPVNVLVKHSLSSTAMQQQPVERTSIPTNQQTSTANNPPVAGIVPQQSPSTAIQQQPIQQQPIESTNTSTAANNPPVAGIVPQQSPSTAIQQQPIQQQPIQQQPIQQQPIQQQPIQQQPIESTNTSTAANNPPVAGIVPQQSPSTAIQQQPIQQQPVESTSIPTNQQTPTTDNPMIAGIVPQQSPSTAIQQQPVESTSIPTNQQTSTANNPPVAGIVPQQSPSTAIQQQPIESTNTSITNTSANNPPVAGIVPQQSPSTAIQQQPIESTSIPTNTLSNGSTTTNTGGPLVANAGQDKTIQSGASVTLDGTDSSGPIISYSWKQISGKSVKLSDANIARSTFVAPIANKDLSLKFKLTVDDSIGRTSTATVNVFVAKR